MPRERLRKRARKLQRKRKKRRNVKLLEKGFVPDETKFGAPFKGKNEIVVA